MNSVYVQFRSTYRTGYDFVGEWLVKPPVNFNPRTRTGYDSGTDKISNMDRFQSTYPHGVRPRLKHDRDMLPYFNPRTRTGYRLRRCKRHQHQRHFNPRTRTGYDTNVERFIPLSEFQSTYPHGVRLTGPLSHRPRPVYFNPRTRTGYDGNEPVPVDPVSDFNPRTRTGYDGLHHRVSSRKRISIHVPHGVRPSSYALMSRAWQFQSTYPHGVQTSFFFRPSS